ncbi:JmjC domain-containing protein [Pycnococcus provasolii]
MAPLASRLVLASSSSSSSSHVSLLDPRTLRCALRRSASKETPLVIKDAFTHIGSSWLSDLVASAENTHVEVLLRENNHTSSFVAPFMEALGEIAHASDHDSSVLIVEEDLLANAPAHVQDAARLPKEICAENKLDQLPPSLRPGTCVLFGGAGSRSSLHADAFGWVGWNYLVEGEKTWTFIPHDAFPADEVCVRVPPAAWAGDNTSIGAGWQTAVDAYAERSADGTSFTARGGTQEHARAVEEAIQNHGITVHQSEGELVIIPPECFHQVYHHTATVAIAGQYADNTNWPIVCRHVGRWVGMPALEQVVGEQQAAEWTPERLAEVAITTTNL